MPPESVVDECAPNREEDAVADAAADAQETPTPGEHQGRAQGQCWQRGRPAHPRVQRLVREAARPRSLSPPWPTSRQRAHSCRPEEDPEEGSSRSGGAWGLWAAGAALPLPPPPQRAITAAAAEASSVVIMVSSDEASPEGPRDPPFVNLQAAHHAIFQVEYMYPSPTCPHTPTPTPTRNTHMITSGMICVYSPCFARPIEGSRLPPVAHRHLSHATGNQGTTIAAFWIGCRERAP